MYYNRDLSWLDFNYRVLREAMSEEVPLYERIKFLSIFSSNLDEFFSIRYPVILAISRLKPKTQKKAENELPDNLLESIQSEIERQFTEFNNILTGRIIPELKENGIVLYYQQTPMPEHKPEIRDIFLSKVLSFLQPILLDSSIAKRFEPEANKIYMIFSLKKEGEDVLHHAILKVPADSLKRFYKLSPVNNHDHVIFIDDIIRENGHYLFPGFEITGIYSIKFNRNQDIDYNEDYSGDIVKKIKKQLLKRSHGLASRFLYEYTMPRNMQLYIAFIFGIDQDEIFAGNRYPNLSDLASFPKFGRELTYEAWKPLSSFRLPDGGDIFKKMEESDMLLHFPYQSYNPILFFFNQAAVDPDVSEIYITLYRLAADSLIANALISAARNGKRVTVFIELKARFDEANNITWSEKMKEAGVQIIYSIPAIKVHTKIALIIKEKEHIKKSYAIISTGNFNELTARIYTDHSLLTVDKETSAELLTLFRFLEKREKPQGGNTLGFKKLMVSQFNLTEVFDDLIANEIQSVKKTGKGLIRIKINNLEEPGMIDRLYEASKAGVSIQLIVRSICRLIPGIPGISDNIVIKRLVDRYLEHSRIFIFGAGDKADVIIGSSDWMTRNLYQRIEVCIKVEDPHCRGELLDYFDLQWRDNVKARIINQRKLNDNPVEHKPTVAPHRAQLSIYQYLAAKQ
jgi:polyphosphate kinase